MATTKITDNLDGTATITREPLDISTKVIAVAAAQFFTAVLLAIVTGDVNDPEVTAAASALITVVLGYFTKDKIEV